MAQQHRVYIDRIVSTAQAYIQLVEDATADPTRIAGSAKGIGVLLDAFHSYGRYTSGNLISVSSNLSTVDLSLGLAARTEAGVNVVINEAVVSRALVSATAATVLTAGNAL